MKKLIILFLILSSNAYSQDNNILFQSKVNNVLQAQRNQAFDFQAVCETNKILLNDEIEKLKAKIIELEKLKEEIKK